MIFIYYMIVYILLIYLVWKYQARMRNNVRYYKNMSVVWYLKIKIKILKMIRKVI
jgi:hypothetical protein